MYMIKQDMKMQIVTSINVKYFLVFVFILFILQGDYAPCRCFVSYFPNGSFLMPCSSL